MTAADAARCAAVTFIDSSMRVDWRNGRFVLAHVERPIVHDLTPEQALGLLLLGKLGDADIARSTALAVGPNCADGVDQVLERFPAYLRGAETREFDPSWWGDRLGFAEGLPSPTYAAPASITWLMTLECNRRCPYCFYRIIPVDGPAVRWPRDATLRGEAARRMVDEMAELGTADLYLTGGEPLLRPDLDAIVRQAAGRGIRAHVVSKFAIERARADALAAAGLHHITISLDDLRPEVTRRLTGAEDYPAQALGAIAACLAAGLNVEVNAVVTNLNADGLSALALELEAMGCRLLTISAMEPPHFRTANTAALEQSADLVSLAAAMRDALAGDLAVAIGGAGGNERRACGESLVCEVGRRSLHILPNGDVTRCHYVPTRPDLVIGSLHERSILDLWTSDAMERWREPDISAFSGTACAGCGMFDGCNRRGRCVASALLDSGRLHAPDAFCHHAS